MNITGCLRFTTRCTTVVQPVVQPAVQPVVQPVVQPLYNRLDELHANEPSRAALKRASQHLHDVIAVTRAANILQQYWF